LAKDCVCPENAIAFSGLNQLKAIYHKQPPYSKQIFLEIFPLKEFDFDF